MEDFSGEFGILLKAKRQEKGISLWKACVQLNIHLRNLQRIESGETEPRLDTAINILLGLDIPVGDFFQELADRAISSQDRQMWPHDHTVALDFSPLSEVDTGFGTLLKQVRKEGKISLRQLCNRTGYKTRNLTYLENSCQNPGVMRALKLICAVGYDVGTFFIQYAELVSRKSITITRTPLIRTAF